MLILEEHFRWHLETFASELHLSFAFLFFSKALFTPGADCIKHLDKS